MDGEKAQSGVSYSQLSSSLRGAITEYMTAKGERLDNQPAAAVAKAVAGLDESAQKALAKEVNDAAARMKLLRGAVTERLRPTRGQDGSAALDAAVSSALDKLTRNNPELKVENLVANPGRASKAIQGMIDAELGPSVAASVSNSLDALVRQFREMEQSKTGTGGLGSGPGYTPPGNVPPPSTRTR